MTAADWKPNHAGKTAELPGARAYGPDRVDLGAVQQVEGNGDETRVVIDVDLMWGMNPRTVSIPAGELRFRRNSRGETQVRLPLSLKHFDVLTHLFRLTFIAFAALGTIERDDRDVAPAAMMEWAKSP